MFFNKRSNFIFLFIALSLILTVAAIVFICLFLPDSLPAKQEFDPGIRSDFPENGEFLTWSNDLYFDYAHRYDPADYDVLCGVDISEWNKMEPDDWADIKNAGLDFVFLRVGFRGYGEAGNLLNDSCFEDYFKGAKEAGLKVGCYIYSQAINRTEIEEEAKLVLDAVSGKDLDMPIVLDCEFASAEEGYGRLYNAHLSKEAYTDLCNYFAEIIRDAGYIPMIYAGTKMLNENIDTERLDSDILLWVAQYYRNCQYVNDDYSFWQFTDSGEVDGVKHLMDFNFWYVPRSAFMDGQDRVECAIKSMCNPHPYEKIAYTDVDESSPYWSAIRFMSDAGILPFREPEYQQNQIATSRDLLYSLYKMSFSEASPDEWLAETGLYLFDEEYQLTYGMMAQMCYQYLAAWDTDFQAERSDKIASSENRYMKWMIQHGLVFDEESDSTQKISRGEYAVLVMDFYRYVGFSSVAEK